QLKLQQMDKPYFIAYRMDEIDDTVVSASLGSLTMSQPSRSRLIGVEVRVGDYTLDNSNYVSMRNLRGGMAEMFGGISQAPLDNNYQQIRRQFWLQTDRQYKKALEDLSAKRAALKMRQGEELPDFSKVSPVSDNQTPVPGGEPGDLDGLGRALSAV